MKYFGFIVQNDSTLNCKEILLTNSESDFGVIDCNEGDQLESYAVFNGNYLFQGCYLTNSSVISEQLRLRLDRCVDEHRFERKVEL